MIRVITQLPFLPVSASPLRPSIPHLLSYLLGKSEEVKWILPLGQLDPIGIGSLES